MAHSKGLDRSELEFLSKYGLGRPLPEGWDPYSNPDHRVHLIKALRRRQGFTLILHSLHPAPGWKCTGYFGSDEFVSEAGDDLSTLPVTVILEALRKRFAQHS